jgi:hypothetical protein
MAVPKTTFPIPGPKCEKHAGNKAQVETPPVPQALSARGRKFREERYIF